MAAMSAATVAVAAMAGAGAVTGWVKALAAASALSTGVSSSRFPSRKISLLKTSASVLVLTAK